MNRALWIAAALLALVAIVGGISKAFVPKEKLAEHPGGEWTRDFNGGFVKTLGVLELGAAVGLILPAVLDIAPIVVPVTAVCWLLLMLGAMITHGRLEQFKFVMLNSVYLTLVGGTIFRPWFGGARRSGFGMLLTGGRMRGAGVGCQKTLAAFIAWGRFGRWRFTH